MVQPSKDVCELRVVLQLDLSMMSRATSTGWQDTATAAFVALDIVNAVTMVNNFIVTRLDYCNAQPAGCSAARVIFSGESRDHMTSLLRDRLHWLHVCERVMFTLCLLVYSSIRHFTDWNQATLLTCLCHFESWLLVFSTRRHWCSTNMTTTWKQSSFVAGPAAWNNLPTYAWTSETLTVFKSRLKTQLFAVSYINWTVVAVAHLTSLGALVVTFATLWLPKSCGIIIIIKNLLLLIWYLRLSALPLVKSCCHVAACITLTSALIRSASLMHRTTTPVCLQLKPPLLSSLVTFFGDRSSLHLSSAFLVYQVFVWNLWLPSRDVVLVFVLFHSYNMIKPLRLPFSEYLLQCGLPCSFFVYDFVSPHASQPPMVSCFQFLTQRLHLLQSHRAESTE